MSRTWREMQEYGDSLRVRESRDLPAGAGWTAEGGCPYVGVAALKLLAPPRVIQYHKSIGCHPMVWRRGRGLAKLFIQKG